MKRFTKSMVCLLVCGMPAHQAFAQSEPVKSAMKDQSGVTISLQSGLLRLDVCAEGTLRVRYTFGDRRRRSLSLPGNGSRFRSNGARRPTRWCCARSVAGQALFAKGVFAGGALRLHFDHTDGGLVVKGATLGEFSVAGNDGNWYWADARIDGDTVVVSSKDVPKPKNVRYAWQSNPEATLYNGSGLPAIPFRTDGKINERPIPRGLNPMRLRSRDMNHEIYEPHEKDSQDRFRVFGVFRG